MILKHVANLEPLPEPETKPLPTLFFSQVFISNGLKLPVLHVHIFKGLAARFRANADST